MAAGPGVQAGRRISGQFAPAMDQPGQFARDGRRDRASRWRRARRSWPRHGRHRVSPRPGRGRPSRPPEMSTIQPAIWPSQRSRGAGAAAGSWRQVAASSRYFPASTGWPGCPWRTGGCHRRAGGAWPGRSEPAGLGAGGGDAAEPGVKAVAELSGKLPPGGPDRGGGCRAHGGAVCQPVPPGAVDQPFRREPASPGPDPAQTRPYQPQIIGR